MPKITIARFIGSIALICVSLFAAAITKAYHRYDGAPTTFPVVTEATRIVLRTSSPDTRVIDLTGNREIIEAIHGLGKSPDLRGRSIGNTRIQGTIEIDGEVFTIDACMTAKAFCATLDNDQRGQWWGEQLGNCLYTRYGYPQRQEIKHTRNQESH